MFNYEDEQSKLFKGKVRDSGATLLKLFLFLIANFQQITILLLQYRADFEHHF